MPSSAFFWLCYTHQRIEIITVLPLPPKKTTIINIYKEIDISIIILQYQYSR